MGENMSVLINKLYKMKSIKRQNTNNDLKSPNWNTIPTKGMNVPSDKELEVKIKEQQLLKKCFQVLKQHLF